MATIDLNADLGELPGPDGAALDAALVALATSVNVAAGGHAGDRASMTRVCAVAAERGVRIGAHLSFPDREGFGRRDTTTDPAALRAALEQQLTELTAAAASVGAVVAYVKPHGALYHRAAGDPALGELLCQVLRAAGLPLLTAASRPLAQWAPAWGVGVFHEAFVDRGYRSDATLVPRDEPGAVVTDHAAVRTRAVAIARGEPVETTDGGRLRLSAHSMCLHGDTPGAVALAGSVVDHLRTNGVTLRSFLP